MEFVIIDVISVRNVSMINLIVKINNLLKRLLMSFVTKIVIGVKYKIMIVILNVIQLNACLMVGNVRIILVILVALFRILAIINVNLHALQKNVNEMEMIVNNIFLIKNK